MQPDDAPAAGREDGTYGWYALGVLVLVYVFNFVDRQLLTILAPDLKRDLGISDSEFGFLYGTAFGLFYALFGIPLGRLADRWSRVRLLTVGLALWSAMTALSGLSRSFGQLAAARIGVGIGEATASPCAYSLIGDWFPPHRRSTALAVYSSGLYIGAGVSLFLGSSIAMAWNDAFAPGTAPLGLAGWQAAFLAVGMPGLLLALWVSSLIEPVRELADLAEKTGVAVPGLWTAFLHDLAAIVPPFTLIAALRRGPRALAWNLCIAAACALLASGLIAWLGDPAQWIAVAIGCYALGSWVSDLRATEPEAFRAIVGSRPVMALVGGYGLVALVGYAGTAFTPLYAIERFGLDAREVGLVLGGSGAVGGALGVIGGGALADKLAARIGEAGRALVTLGSSICAFAAHLLIFGTTNFAIFYFGVLLGWVFFSATLGGAAGSMVGMVAPRHRGLASAAFIVGTTLLGLALGPYSAGKLSQELGNLRNGMLALLAVAPVSVLLLSTTYRDLKHRPVN